MANKSLRLERFYSILAAKIKFRDKESDVRFSKKSFGSLVRYLGWVSLVLAGALPGLLIGFLLGNESGEGFAKWFMRVAVGMLVSGITLSVGYAAIRIAWSITAQKTKNQIVAYVKSNKEALLSATHELINRNLNGAIKALPSGSEEIVESAIYVIRLYIRLTAIAASISMLVATALGLLATAVLYAQNELIREQNNLIKKQAQLAEAQLWQEAMLYVNEAYDNFKRNEEDYPQSRTRKSTHYSSFDVPQQETLCAYWYLVHEQWRTLNVAQEAHQLNTTQHNTPSITVWDKYMVPVLQNVSQKKAQTGALCYLVREKSWPTGQPGFMASLRPAIDPHNKGFFGCCEGKSANLDTCVEKILQTPSPSRGGADE